jgi:hypothetical protein
MAVQHEARANLGGHSKQIRHAGKLGQQNQRVKHNVQNLQSNGRK